MTLEYVTTREIDIFREELRESRQEILAAVERLGQYQKEQNSKVNNTIERLTVLETTDKVGKDLTSRWLGVVALIFAGGGLLLKLFGKG